MGTAARAGEAAQPRGLVAGGRAVVVALDEGVKTEGVSRTSSLFCSGERITFRKVFRPDTTGADEESGGSLIQTCTRTVDASLPQVPACVETCMPVGIRRSDTYGHSLRLCTRSDDKFDAVPLSPM